jgi:hypothetical protein
MTDKYTPSMDELRAAWQEHFTHPEAGTLGEQFDRAIAAHDAEVRAEARRKTIVAASQKAVTMALAFTAWPREGERYDAGPMVKAIVEELERIQAQNHTIGGAE